MKEKLNIICVLFTEDIGGIILFVFDEEGRQVDHTRDYNDSSRFRPTWRLPDAIFYPTNFVGGKVSCEGKGSEDAPPPK